MTSTSGLNRITAPGNELIATAGGSNTLTSNGINVLTSPYNQLLTTVGGTNYLDASSTGSNTITGGNNSMSATVSNLLISSTTSGSNTMQSTGQNGYNRMICDGSNTLGYNQMYNLGSANTAANKIESGAGDNYITTTTGGNFLLSYKIVMISTIQNYVEVNTTARYNLTTSSNAYYFNPTGANRWQIFDNGTTDSLYILQGASANGVYLGNGANAWTAWSDERVKKNIEPIESALDNIMKLNPVSYNYKKDDDMQAKRVGFVAQEVDKIFPDIVNESGMDSDDVTNILGLDTTALIPYLVKAIQELRAEVRELQAKN